MRIRTCRTTRSRSSTTASSRTSRRCATRLQARGLSCSRRRPTASRSRTSCTAHWHGAAKGDLLARGAAGGGRIRRRVRDRSDLVARAGTRRRRAAGQSARRGHRRRRPLPRLRRRGAGAGHAARGVPRGRRRRRRAARAATRSTTRRAARRAHGRRRARHRGDAVELGPYRHFMQKEIFEQPRAVADTLEAVDGDRARALRRRSGATLLRDVDAVLILACGTSYYSSLVAKQWIETLARHPVHGRDRERIPLPRQRAATRSALVVVVSQSGETADTLAALKHAKSLGQTQTLADLQRRDELDGAPDGASFLTRAGTEIGVASTKAFTTQLVALFLLALHAGQAARPALGEDEAEWIARRCATCRRRSRRARARAAAHRRGRRRSRKQAACAVPRPRPALSDRARRRAEAEGDLVHPRRGVSGRRAEARAAGAGRRADAGRRRSRRTTRCSKSSRSQPAGSARARRRALCRRRPRQRICRRRRHAPDPRARARGAAVARSCTSFRCSCSRITPR